MIVMVSILGDIDDQIKAGDENLRNRVIEFLEENYNGKFVVSKEPNKNGLYEVSSNDDVVVKNKNIIALTNGMFEWKNVGGNFYCCDCQKLETLECVPENISGNYYCTNNHSLILKNKNVAFNCKDCGRFGFFHFCNFTFKSQDDALKDILPPSYVRIEDKYHCATLDFIAKVKDVYQKKVMPSIKNMVNSHWLIKYLICIIKNIPIHFEKQDGREYLGLYRRSHNDNEKEIILFEDAIKAESNGDEEYLDNLIWKVIVHEYAHAIMDTMYDRPEDSLKQQDAKLYKYREESLANAFALNVLNSNKDISNAEFDKIIKFVGSQTEEYRHGLDLYKRKDLFKMMEFWREVKILGNRF